MRVGVPQIMPQNNTLTILDHKILVSMIRGYSTDEIMDRYGITRDYLSKKLKRMKDCVGCDTIYQLIVLEVTNLSELDPSKASVLIPGLTVQHVLDILFADQESKTLSATA